MLRISDLIAQNIPTVGSRTVGQTVYMQIYNTLGGPAGQKAGFMKATEAAVTKYLGLPPGSKIDTSKPLVAVTGTLAAAAGTIDWASLLAFLEQLWTTLAPILIPLL